MTDSGGTANPNELGTQAAFNYHYNEIGHLTDDDTAKIHQITWDVYGKIRSLSDSGNVISLPIMRGVTGSARRRMGSRPGMCGMRRATS